VRRSKNSKKRPSVSPERQASNIAELCAQRGWTVEWFRDTEGHRSGLTELKRPEWLRLKERLERARPGEITAVVVNSLDRSSRKAKDFLNFLELLKVRSTEFVAVTQPYLDTTTPYGRAMIASMMIYAQLEAEIDSQRLVEDIEYRQSEGQMWGPAPIGYGPAREIDGSRLRIRPPDDDAPLVARLLARYAQGGISMRELAAAANLYPAAHLAGGFWRMRRRDGSRVPFTERSVESILDNAPIYAGRIVRFGGKDAEETYEGKHLPIIPDELAARVGQVRADRRSDRGLVSRPRQSRVYLLAGLLHCAACGARLRGQMLRGRPRYWHEQSHGWARLDAERAERDVVDALKAWEIPPELVPYLERPEVAAPIAIDGTAAQVRRLEQQLTRELDLYRLGDQSRVDYLRHKAEVESALGSLRPRVAGASSPSALAAALGNLRGRLLDPNPDPLIVRDTLRALVERVDTDGQKISLLKLHPWADAIFKRQIDLYPQPASRSHVDLILGRPPTPICFRERCQDRNAEIARRRQLGETYRVLAAAYSISIARVAQICTVFRTE